jgi:hypothetical protein
MRTKLRVADLAAELGLSERMVYKLRKRGMPTHSAGAAQAWRAANLDPALVKEHRQPFESPRKRDQERSGEARDSSAGVRLVERLGALAAADFEAWCGELQGAMRDLPGPPWPEVILPLDVWRGLVAPVAAAQRAGWPLEAAHAYEVHADAVSEADLMFLIAAGFIAPIPRPGETP